MCCLIFFFFFQAEDGIRDATVTGVQTCDLPLVLPLGKLFLDAVCRRAPVRQGFQSRGRAHYAPSGQVAHLVVQPAYGQYPSPGRKWRDPLLCEATRKARAPTAESWRKHHESGPFWCADWRPAALA